MNKISILIRNIDKKEFTVADLSHWSIIKAADGETDTVKWYGGGDVELFVGASSGHTYYVKQS